MRNLAITLTAALLFFSTGPAQPAGSAKYIPVEKYDPARNADKDLRDAIIEAQRTGRRILLEVGGDWCKWCHILDRFFAEHPDVVKLREAGFLMVKINFSEENLNKEFLDRFPPVAGYPHFFVLESSGKLLHSQDTGKLEEGEGYNLKKFSSFLEEWSPARHSAPAM